MAFIKGQIGYWTGKKRPDMVGHKWNCGRIPWNKGLKGFQAGENSPTWKGGFPKCSDCEKQLLSYGSKRCRSCATKKRGYIGRIKTTEEYRKIGLKGLISQQNSKEPTSIEKKVYTALQEKGLLFEKQKVVNGRFIVDAFIPSLNLVIEADGDYWHGLDRVQKKDKAENAYLTKCGYKLLRLSEQEINSGRFIERLVA